MGGNIACRISVLLLLCLAVAACGEDDGSNPVRSISLADDTTGSIALFVTLPSRSRQKITLTTVTATLTKGDFLASTSLTLSGNTTAGTSTTLTLSGNTASGRFSDLEPGTYAILVELFDGANLLGRGIASVAVGAGQTAPANMVITLAGTGSLDVNVTMTGGVNVTQVTATISKGSFSASQDLTITSNTASGTFSDLAAGTYIIQVELFNGASLIGNGIASSAVGPSQAATAVLIVNFVSMPPSPFPLTVTLSVAAQFIMEMGGATTVTAMLSATSTKNVTVVLKKDGTATENVDYTLMNTITIPAGSPFASIPLTALDDAFDEPDEIVVIEIVSVINAIVADIRPQTVTIIDDG